MIQPWQQPGSPAAQHADTHADLAGPRLYTARGLWLALLALILILTITGLPARYNQLLAAADVRSLGQLGLSPAAYATYLTGLTVISLAANLLIGIYIFWRRSAHRMCLLVSFTLVANGAIVPLTLFSHARPLAPEPRALLNLVLFLALVSSMLLLYVFPDGRFTPRWTRLLAPVWAVTALVATFLPDLPFSLTRLPAALQVLVLLVWAGTGAYAQIYRYLHISSPVQRQQAKWAGLSLGAAVLGPLSYFLPFVILPALSGPAIPTFLYRRVGGGFFALSLASQLVTQGVFTLLLILFPVLLAIAILRYRLWDIDLLINRALVYGTLTATLALAYLSSIVLLQEGFRVVTGQRQEQWVTVLSTLLIAALAGSLRRWVQTAIDRRFYRRKYDAVRTLAAFGSAVRDEVDIDRLNDRLLGMVDETMQPHHSWLWLRTNET